VPVTLTEKEQEPDSARRSEDMVTLWLPGFATTIPGMSTPPLLARQFPAMPFGEATTKPLGILSANLRSESTVVVFGFVMVKVRVVVPFSARLAAPNDLTREGGDTTAAVAVLLVAPGPVSFEEIGPVVFALTPGVVAFRLTIIVHESLADSVAPARLMDDEPAAAVAVPPQLLLRLFGEATTNPEGSASANEIPESDMPGFGFSMVKKMEIVPFSATLLALKNLLIVGASAAVTVSVALEVFPAPPSVEVTVTVLFLVPAVVAVTLTERLQEAPAANVIPDKLTDDEPLTAETTPLQLLLNPFGVATTRPVGRLSVKAIPVS